VNCIFVPGPADLATIGRLVNEVEGRSALALVFT